MIGALAAVLGDAPSELGERQHQRVVQQPEILQIGVERCQPVIQRHHQLDVGARVRGRVLRRVRVEATRLHPEHLGADALGHRARDRLQRLAKPVIGIGDARLVGAHCRHAVERGHRGLRRRADKRDVRLVDRYVRRDADGGRSLEHGLVSGIRTVEGIPADARDRGDRHRRGLQRVRRVASGVPRNQWIERRRKRGEVTPHPPVARRIRRVSRGPDVGAGEMRSAGVLVPDALDQRESTLIEDILQPSEFRMQTQRFAAGVAADLQDGPGGNPERRPPAVIERIGVGHQHAQAVVATAQIQHDQIAALIALRARQVREKRWRGKTDRERRHAAFDERASRKCHRCLPAAKPGALSPKPYFYANWYSADPSNRWTMPGAFDWSCVSEPVHAPPALA